MQSDDRESQPLLGSEVKTTSNVPNAKYILATNTGLSFAVYGLNSILAVYLKNNLHLTSSQASFLTNFSLFLNYGFALIGGIISDSKSGHFKMITFGLITTFFALLMFLGAQLFNIFLYESINVLLILSLIALFIFVFGGGLMKPSVSAFLGDQFSPQEDRLRTSYFSWFYLSIQCGSIVTSIGAPIMLQYTKPWILFVSLAAPMVLVLLIFISPSSRYRKTKPQGENVFTKCMKVIWKGMVGHRSPDEGHWLDKAKKTCDNKTVEDVKTSLRVLLIFLPLPLFWAIFFQMYSMWIFQAAEMDLKLHFGKHHFVIPPAIVGSLNPLMDIFLIPLFAKLVYPFFAKIGLPLSDLTKMGLGLLSSCAALIVTGFVQLMMSKHPIGTISIFWIFPQFFFVSCAEILLSVTAYEFAYTQSPKNLKGMLTAFWLLTLAAGNVIVAIVGIVNIKSQFTQSFVMAGIMGLVFFFFLWIAKGYKYTDSGDHNETIDQVENVEVLTQSDRNSVNKD